VGVQVDEHREEEINVTPKEPSAMLQFPQRRALSFAVARRVGEVP